MKKLLGGIAISALLAAPALAADLPARVPVKAPAPVVVVATWTGCYIGGHAGAARANTKVTDVDAYSAGAPAGTVTSVHHTGFMGGGQLGCNWQNGQFVFGIEGDVGYMGIGGDALLTGSVSGSRAGVRSTWYADVTGRLGIAFNQALLYGKGGVAFTGRLPTFSTVTGSFSGVTFSNEHVGWTAGGGLEYRLAGNWTGKVEYMYFRFNKNDFTVFNAGGAPFRFHERVDIHTIKVGLNYYFNSPVVARY